MVRGHWCAQNERVRLPLALRTVSKLVALRGRLGTALTLLGGLVSGATALNTANFEMR